MRNCKATGYGRRIVRAGDALGSAAPISTFAVVEEP